MQQCNKKEVNMERVHLDEFIKNWTTSNIKWKILSYLLSRENLNIKNMKVAEQNYSFGRNVLPGETERFRTGNNKYLYYFFPFQNDETKIVRLPFIYSFLSFWKEASKQSHSTLKIKKTTITKITQENIRRIKVKINSEDHYWEPSYQMGNVRNEEDELMDKSNRVLDFRKLDINNATHFKYKNCTAMYETKEGVFWNLEQSIIICYPPYNNGCDRQFGIYHNNYYRELVVSPLQFLWRIRKRSVTLSQLKKIASSNKIKGRAKLKTYEDYLQVFSKL